MRRGCAAAAKVGAALWAYIRANHYVRLDASRDLNYLPGLRRNMDGDKPGQEGWVMGVGRFTRGWSMIATDRQPYRTILAAAFLALLTVTTIARPQSGDSPIIASVVPAGNRITPTAQIMSQIKTRPGQPYSEATAREDVQKLKESGAFADVRVRVQNTVDHKIVVIFDLAELPSLVREIVYKGAKHKSTSDLETLTGLKRGTPLNPIANQLACHAIEDKYKEDGHFYARVSLDEGDKIGDTRVVFNITEGPEVKIKHIEFMGQSDWVNAIPGISNSYGGRLRQQIVSGRAYFGLGGTFDPHKLEEDKAKILEYYRNLGYLNARVSAEIVPSRDFSCVTLIFHIDEGPRYTVGQITLQGNKEYTDQNIRRMVVLQEGQPYDNKVAQADAKSIQNLYGYQGERAQVHESIIQTSVPGKVDIVYQITEAHQVRIRNINIVGNTHTKENIILRVLGLYEGQVLMWPEVENAEKRLAATGFFEASPEKGKPTILVVDTDDPNYKDLIVTVH